MCRHAGFRWGGELGWGNALAAREGTAAVRSGRAGLWVVRFVLCFLLICIVVVPAPFVCCSVKLPLSRPTSFCLFSFHSPPHSGGGRGGRMVLLLPAAAKPEQGLNHNFCKISQHLGSKSPVKMLCGRGFNFILSNKMVNFALL